MSINYFVRNIKQLLFPCETEKQKVKTKSYQLRALIPNAGSEPKQKWPTFTHLKGFEFWFELWDYIYEIFYERIMENAHF